MNESSRYLCIGLALAETVVHLPERFTRHGIGGVAGQMAHALAHHGQSVTALSPRNRGTSAVLLERLAQDAGITPVLLPNRTHAHSEIYTLHGEIHRQRGSWPTACNVATTASRLSAEHDWLLLDCNVDPAELARCLNLGRRRGKPTLVNASSPGLATTLLQTHCDQKTAVTMNRDEADAIMRRAGINDQADLCAVTNSQWALVTGGCMGWVLYRGRLPVTSSPGPEPTDDTDFVGCGDWAAAGLAQALADGQHLTATINRYIAARMELNRIPLEPDPAALAAA